MIRFRHAASLPSVAVGDSLVEVVLVNSHDGTSSYKLTVGQTTDTIPRVILLGSGTR